MNGMPVSGYRDRTAGNLAPKTKRVIPVPYPFPKPGKVLAATHVHLDHHNCLEVTIRKGREADLQKLADGILNLRGVKHGRLVITTTGIHLH